VPVRHVRQSDAFTLALERDPALRATIVAVALLDRSPDWDRLTERIERATRLAPEFRQRLVPSPLGLAPPRWVPDPDFDLSWHLRRQRLPDGAALPALLEVARHASMAAFDHDRPLWEFTLVEGLPDGAAALVLKVHHALTDGIGGVQIAAQVVDLTREGFDLGPLPPAPAVARSRPFEDVVESVGYDLRRVADVGTGLLRAAPGALVGAVRDPLGATARTLREVGSLARFVRPVTTTRSPVMRDRRLLRHLELLDVPVADLKAAGAAVGGTVNDAFVAAVAGGMRIYHERHGATTDALRVTMPISVRAEGDRIGGNRITLVRLDLPVATADPRARMEEVHEICRAQRDEPALAHSEAVAAALNLLPVSVTGSMLHHTDLLASNVPGFDLEAYVAGARVQGFYAFGATLGSAANITLMSYDGMANIGVNVDSGAVPDPDAFLTSLRDGFAEVVAVGHPAARRQRRVDG
jgi:WS/DGAT/MGAT family acyltransferase